MASDRIERAVAESLPAMARLHSVRSVEDSGAGGEHRKQYGQFFLARPALMIKPPRWILRRVSAFRSAVAHSTLTHRDWRDAVRLWQH